MWCDKVCASNWDRSVCLGPLGASDLDGGPHDPEAAQTETHMVQANLHFPQIFTQQGTPRLVNKLMFFIYFNYFLKSVYLVYIYIYIYTHFSHLADAFIQSDLQMRTIETIKTNKRATTCKCNDKSGSTPMALFHCMVRHGMVRYGSLLGGFPLGTVPGTWYFFSTTSAEVPSDPYRYQNVTCKLCWSLIGRRESSLLRQWTCDMRPARFKSAQPAKERTHLFASTTNYLFHCLLRKYRRSSRW